MCEGFVAEAVAVPTSCDSLVRLRLIFDRILFSKGRHAKDGLHQYKNICGANAIGSLETVIKYYIKTTEDRVEKIRSKLDANLVLAEDLEASETPEGYVLCFLIWSLNQIVMVFMFLSGFFV